MFGYIFNDKAVILLTLIICEKKYEASACIINVWGYTEILPKTALNAEAMHRI